MIALCQRIFSRSDDNETRITTRQKKALSAKGLLCLVKKIFNKVPQTRINTRGNDRNIRLADLLMSAFGNV